MEYFPNIQILVGQHPKGSDMGYNECMGGVGAVPSTLIYQAMLQTPAGRPTIRFHRLREKSYRTGPPLPASFDAGHKLSLLPYLNQMFL